MIRVAIIEDNAYMREGWKTILDFEQDMVVNQTFDSCESAFESEDFGNNDLLLLDIELPGMDGTEGLKIIKNKYPKLLVLMVTMHDENEKIFKALRNGAIGYLLKKISPAELIIAIKTAMEGGSPMSPNIARKVINSFQTSNKIKDELNERELEILSALSEGMSYKAIADKMFLSIDGIRYHIRHIYQKLEAKNRADAVTKGLKFNLISSDS